MNQLTFGTDGIRGHVGEFPFTEEALNCLGMALGHWLTTYYTRPNGTIKVLLAGDTRESVDPIKKKLINGIIKFPINLVDAGVIPTPAVFTLIKNDTTFSCGLMISASHNPYYDNGIKLFDTSLGKLPEAEEKNICQLFQFYSSQGAQNESLPTGTLSNWPSAARNYIDHLVQTIPPLIGKGRRIVLDCAHGASYLTAPAVFEKLGAEVIVIHNQPNGININDKSGALHPEALQKSVLENAADIGFAFDGDADRVIAVTSTGNIKDGDDILPVLLDLKEYATVPIIVGTVMSNAGLEFYLKNQSKSLIRTPVGDKYISSKLEELDLPLGGEPSGHIIMKNLLTSGDGTLVAAKILQSLSQTGRWQIDYIEKFPQITINIPIQKKHDLKNEPYAEILRTYDSMLENGRILVRYSGTEALLRIMVESKEKQKTEDIALKLAHTLKQALNT